MIYKTFIAHEQQKSYDIQNFHCTRTTKSLTKPKTQNPGEQKHKLRT